MPTRAELQAEVDRLSERFESYGGGDRPSSPPAQLLRDLFDAREALRQHGTTQESPPAAPAVAPTTERTFAMIKPDAYARAVEILVRVQEEGFVIVEMHTFQHTPETVAEFYAEHVRRHFFEAMSAFLCSGPSVLLVLERKSAVAHWRSVMGPTDPKRAKLERVAAAYDRRLKIEEVPGTLRAIYGDQEGPMFRNAVHGSDKPEAAAREIALAERWLHGPARDTSPITIEALACRACGRVVIAVDDKRIGEHEGCGGRWIVVTMVRGGEERLHVHGWWTPEHPAEGEMGFVATRRPHGVLPESTEARPGGRLDACRARAAAVVAGVVSRAHEGLASHKTDRNRELAEMVESLAHALLKAERAPEDEAR